MRRLLRALFFVLLIVGAMSAPFVLLPIAVRWPARRESAIVEVIRKKK